MRFLGLARGVRTTAISICPMAGSSARSSCCAGGRSSSDGYSRRMISMDPISEVDPAIAGAVMTPNVESVSRKLRPSGIGCQELHRER